MKNKVLSIALVVIVILAVLVFKFVPFGNNSEELASDTTVYVTVVNGSVSEEHTITTKCANLGDALLEEGLIKGESGEYGLYITEASGIAANAEKEQWWCITKGGEAVMTGVSQIKIQNGDKYELTLKEGY